MEYKKETKLVEEVIKVEKEVVTLELSKEEANFIKNVIHTVRFSETGAEKFLFKVCKALSFVGQDVLASPYQDKDYNQKMLKNLAEEYNL